MTLNFWNKTSGTWINLLTILLGTLLGLFLNRYLNSRFQKIITQSVGLVVLFISFQMSQSLTKVKIGSLDGILLGLFCLTFGGMIGEFLKIDDRLEQLGNYLKRKFKGKGRFSEGFITSSLLFSIGPMAIIGSLQNGLSGDNQILVIKAILDGFTSIALSSSYGLGVALSGVVIVFFQGGLSLLSANLSFIFHDPAHHPIVLLLTGVGGLMLIASAFNLLSITKISLASFFPALLLSPILYFFAVLWL